MKIAIIVRKETFDKCTGRGCLNAFFKRKDAFADCPADTELVGFTHHAGDLDSKIEKLKGHGVDRVYISTCVRGKCPKYEEMASRFARDFDVVGYTHGSFEGRTRTAICLDKRIQASKNGAEM